MAGPLLNQNPSALLASGATPRRPVALTPQEPSIMDRINAAYAAAQGHYNRGGVSGLINAYTPSYEAMQGFGGDVLDAAEANPDFVDDYIHGGLQEDVLGDMNNPIDALSLLFGGPLVAGSIKKVGPKLSKEMYESFVRSNSRKRRNWGEDRKSLYQQMTDTHTERVVPWGQDTDPLVSAARTRQYRLKEHKAAKSLDTMSGGLWNKKMYDDVLRDTQNDWPSDTSINRANLEAVPRALKKEGWTVRHGSTGKSGRKTSRYVVSPDGSYEVRISDHELPDTPQRQYSREQTGGPRWNDEIVLRGDESPQSVIDEIKSLFAEVME